jgi:hypothetical protein
MSGGSRLTTPESGVSMPARTRSKVDFPMPFGPTTPIRLPGATVRETRSRTTTSANDLLMFRAASTPRECDIRLTTSWLEKREEQVSVSGHA